MHFTYCPHCGSKLADREIGDEGLVPYCSQCRRPLFDLTETCTITLALNEYGEVALLRQDYVSKSSYVCVAGHIKPGENAEETAVREVEEEIGLKTESIFYIGSYYHAKNDLLMLGFLARVKKAELRLSCEVDRADWFALEEAPEMVRQGSIAQQLILDSMKKLKELRTAASQTA